MPQVKAAKQMNATMQDSPPVSDNDRDTDLDAWVERNRDAIDADLKRIIEENNYKPLTEEVFEKARRIARGEEKWPNPEL